MSESHIDRRRVLTLGATLGVWSALGRPAGAAQDPVPPPDDNRLYSCTVQIAGLPEASKNIREIAIDELNIDAREMKAGGDHEIWQIKPGSVHVGSATFTIGSTPGARKELQAWWAEAAKGKNIRKNISVTLFKSDRKTERAFSLTGCFPTSWSSVNFDTSSTVQTETLTVKIHRIEFKT
jgi:phage tail-like protein